MKMNGLCQNSLIKTITLIKVSKTGKSVKRTFL